jgi:hypothetical protein
MGLSAREGGGLIRQDDHQEIDARQAGVDQLL